MGRGPKLTAGKVWEDYFLVGLWQIEQGRDFFGESKGTLGDSNSIMPHTVQAKGLKKGPAYLATSRQQIWTNTGKVRGSKDKFR